MAIKAKSFVYTTVDVLMNSFSLLCVELEGFGKFVTGNSNISVKWSTITSVIKYAAGIFRFVEILISRFVNFLNPEPYNQIRAVTLVHKSEVSY